jgi:hypothetical protein
MSDLRYDRTASNNIVDQAQVWKHIEGFWSFSVKSYAPGGSPLEPSQINPDDNDLIQANLPYAYFPALGFLNVTIVGSRLFLHRYYVLSPAPFSFCQQEIVPGLVNVLGNGSCGETGYSYSTDFFATSTYERDGTIVALAFDSNQHSSQEHDHASHVYISWPVDNRTLQMTTRDARGHVTTETLILTDNAYTRMASVSEQHTSLVDQGELLAFFHTDYNRIQDATSFQENIALAYEANNVPTEDRIQGGQLPMVSSCLGQTCPKEETWCRIDPNCSTSPYQTTSEAKAIKISLVVGFALLGASIMILVLCWHHRRTLSRQGKRHRIEFARKVAESIEITESSYALTPEELMEEFKKLDPHLKFRSESKGMIQKETMKGFLQSGKVGYITETDFGALWASLDTQHTGYVDFLEFCTLLAGCHEEFLAPGRSRAAAAKLVTKKLSKVSMRDVSVRSKSIASGVLVGESTDTSSPMSEESLRSTLPRIIECGGNNPMTPMTDKTRRSAKVHCSDDDVVPLEGTHTSSFEEKLSTPSRVKSDQILQNCSGRKLFDTSNLEGDDRITPTSKNTTNSKAKSLVIGQFSSGRFA